MGCFCQGFLLFRIFKLELIKYVIPFYLKVFFTILQYDVFMHLNRHWGVKNIFYFIISLTMVKIFLFSLVKTFYMNVHLIFSHKIRSFIINRNENNIDRWNLFIKKIAKKSVTVLLYISISYQLNRK